MPVLLQCFGDNLSDGGGTPRHLGHWHSAETLVVGGLRGPKKYHVGIVLSNSSALFAFNIIILRGENTHFIKKNTTFHLAGDVTS